jgi:small conductance mechanosensitive channel
VILPPAPLPLANVLFERLERFLSAFNLNLGDLLDKATDVVVILVLAWIGRRVLRVVTNRLRRIADDGDPSTMSTAEQRAHTLASITHSVGSVLIWLGAGLMILDLFIEIGPLLAGIGVMGLAVSFGAQSLVKDVISGFFILFENQFGVGDVVTINGIGGKVERMTLRVAMLRDLEGVLHVIPNGSITVVSNRTRGFARTVVDVRVAYAEPIDRVIAVLRDLGREFWNDSAWRPMLEEEPQVLGVEELEDSAVSVRVLLTTLPGKQWDVGREFRRRLKNRFDAEGITIPFPQRTLHLGSADALIDALGGRRGTGPA